MNFRFSCILSLMLLGNNPCALAGNVVLRGRVQDAATGKLTACTVSITDSNGKIVTESESFKTGFRCAGEFVKTLPAGRTRIRVSRGFETKAQTQDLDLQEGKEVQVNFS